MSLPGRQVQLATGASLLEWEVAGGWEVYPGIRSVPSPFPLPPAHSNYQSAGGFRDQFSSQQLPTLQPACAWLT